MIQSLRTFIADFVEQYRNWSLPFKVFLWIIASVTLYIGVLEPSYNEINKLNAHTDRLQERMDTAQRYLARQNRTVRDGMEIWGDPTMPAGAAAEESRTLALQKVITSILNKHGITTGVKIEQHDWQTLKSAKQRSSRGAKSNQNEIERASKEVQFKAAPDVFAAVLADLEKQPEIARISRLNIRRDTRRTVLEVALVVEVWREKIDQ